MPRSDEQHDRLHTFTSAGEGKSKTTRIAPLELGRDKAPTTRLTLKEVDQSTVRNATPGSRIVHMDPAGELRVKDPNGNSREVRGADSLQALTGSPVSVGGTADVEVTRGQSVTDETGSKRLSITSSSTALHNTDGDEVLRARDGSFTALDARPSEPLLFFDADGSFTAVEYSATGTPPGSLRLENAVLDFQAGLGSGAADGMAADPEADSEDGFIVVEIAGTRFQVPAYLP